MSVKVAALIKDFSLDTNGITVRMKIQADDGQHADDVAYGPVSSGTADLLLNTNLLEFVKQYAIDNFGTEFGMMDQARVIHVIDSTP